MPCLLPSGFSSAPGSASTALLGSTLPAPAVLCCADQWTTAHDVIMPHEIPAGWFSFLFLLFSPTRHGRALGEPDKGAPASHPCPGLCRTSWGLLRPSKPHRRPLFCNWVTSPANLYHGWRRCSPGRAWRQASLSMAVVWLYYHVAIGGAERPVIPRSHPEQVVAEVDMGVANSPCIGNAKLQASGGQAQCRLSPDSTFLRPMVLKHSDPPPRAPRVVQRPVQVLTAANGPERLHCRKRRVFSVSNKVFGCTGNLLRYVQVLPIVCRSPTPSLPHLYF